VVKLAKALELNGNIVRENADTHKICLRLVRLAVDGATKRIQTTYMYRLALYCIVDRFN